MLILFKYSSLIIFLLSYKKKKSISPTRLIMTGVACSAAYSAIGTIFMALLANYPFALAPSMGLNAFFAFAVCRAMGYSWQVALAAVFVEGLLFIVMSLTPIRETLFNCIPMSLKLGVSAYLSLLSACRVQSW